MTAVKELNSLYLADNRQRFPSLPDGARCVPKFKMSTAGGLSKAIITYLRLQSWQCERVANMGRVVSTKQNYIDSVGFGREMGSSKYIPGTGTNGTSDLKACIMGRHVSIEIKIRSDRQSKAQIQYQDDVENAGGVYIIIRDFEGFVEWYKEFITELS